MYAFIPALVFLGIGIWLYQKEWKKKPDMRSKANIMLAGYAVIMGIALFVVSFLYWGEI